MTSVAEIVAGILRVHAENVKRIVSDPDGDHPKCKPAVGVRPAVCERCGRLIESRSSACEASDSSERWGILPVPQASSVKLEKEAIMRESPLCRVPDHGCCCWSFPATCFCDPCEKGLRTIHAGFEPMDDEQRAWCLEEIRAVEGWGDYELSEDDKGLALDVLRAWQDFCRDKGLIA